MKKGLRKSKYYLAGGVLLIIVAASCFLSFLLHGSSVTVSGGKKVAVTRSVSCESNEVVYPFDTSDAADKRSLEVKMVLNNDKIDTISLIYKLYYSDASMIEKARTRFNSSINSAFGEDGLDADALGVTYSALSDAMQMTLYAEAKDINETTSKYFLLEDTKNDYEINRILKMYNKKGLSCIIYE